MTTDEVAGIVAGLMPIGGTSRECEALTLYIRAIHALKDREIGVMRADLDRLRAQGRDQMTDETKSGPYEIGYEPSRDHENRQVSAWRIEGPDAPDVVFPGGLVSVLDMVLGMNRAFAAGRLAERESVIREVEPSPYVSATATLYPHIQAMVDRLQTAVDAHKDEARAWAECYAPRIDEPPPEALLSWPGPEITPYEPVGIANGMYVFRTRAGMPRAELLIEPGAIGRANLQFSPGWIASHFPGRVEFGDWLTAHIQIADQSTTPF